VGCAAVTASLDLSPLHPEPSIEVLPPSTTILAPVVRDACPEPSTEDTLPTSEIQQRIAINVVSQLDAMEQARSLLIEEQSLREFLLDQILSLQALLEPKPMPRCVEELLDRGLVTSPPLAKDILSPPVVEGKGMKWCSVVVMDAYPEPSAVGSLLTPKIRLHITINVVSRLNAAEEARSLSVEELSLHEFLLDEILIFQELLELSLVPRIVDELLAR
jgi:hypothetical protein